MSDPGERIVVVSDLHMGAGADDPFTADDRFADALADLAAGTGGRRLRVVLLGDVVDFPAIPLAGARVTPATRPSDAVAKLDRVVEAHPTVFSAIRALVEAGHRVDVVAGNHDGEVLFPAVGARLRAALGGSAGRVTLHPWMLYVPGVLYAEHGHMHHDLNRFPWPGVLPEERRLRVPVGSYVDALTHLRSRQPDARPRALAVQAARMGVGALTALARSSREERRRTGRQRELPSSLASGLPPAAVLGIDRITSATPASIARRAVGMAAARRRAEAVDGPKHYLHAAAERVHRVLVTAGCPVPYHVFGHTHLQEDLPLDGNEARYLNPGTWSGLTRRVEGGQRRFGAVVIDRTPGEPPRARIHVRD